MLRRLISFFQFYEKSCIANLNIPCGILSEFPFDVFAAVIYIKFVWK